MRLQTAHKYYVITKQRFFCGMMCSILPTAISASIYSITCLRLLELLDRSEEKWQHFDTTFISLCTLTVVFAYLKVMHFLCERFLREKLREHVEEEEREREQVEGVEFVEADPGQYEEDDEEDVHEDEDDEEDLHEEEDDEEDVHEGEDDEEDVHEVEDVTEEEIVDLTHDDNESDGEKAAVEVVEHTSEQVAVETGATEYVHVHSGEGEEEEASNAEEEETGVNDNIQNINTSRRQRKRHKRAK